MGLLGVKVNVSFPAAEFPVYKMIILLLSWKYLLKAAGLFKYVWCNSRRQGLKW